MVNNFKKNKSRLSLGVVVVALFSGISFSITRITLREESASAVSGAAAGAFNYMAGQGCAFTSGSSWAYNNIAGVDWSTLNNWYDTCFGASWREYSVSSLADGSWYIPSNGQQGDSASTIKSKCEAIDATKVYRYAYETYTPRKAKENKNLLSSATGKQGPSLIWGQSKKYLQYSLPGTMDSAKVEELFKLAAKWDSDKNDSTIDGKTLDGVSWFCYNPDWGDMTGKFESETFLEYDGGKEQSGIDKEKTVQPYKTDDEEVTLTFYHKLRYTFGSKTSGKAQFDEVKTDYTIPNKESGDGAKEGSFAANPGNKDKAWEEVSRETVKVTLKEGESKTVCRKIKYQPKNVTFAYDNGKYKVKDDEKKDSEDSEICIKVTRNKEDEEEEPDPEGEEVEDRGKVYSQSGVGTRSKNSRDMIEIPIQMSDEWDKTVEVRVSTDEDHATVVFKHVLSWDDNLYDPKKVVDNIKPDSMWGNKNEGKCDGKNWIPGSTSGTAVECDTDPVDVQYTPEPSADEKKDKFVEPVKVEWEVTQEESGVGSAADGSDKGEYTIEGKGPQTVYDERDIDLSGLEIGQSLQVCQKITHPETIVLEVKEVNHEAKEWTGEPSAEAKQSCDKPRYDAAGRQMPGLIKYNDQGNDEDYCMEPETQYSACATTNWWTGQCIPGNVFTGDYQSSGNKMAHEYDEGLMAHLRWDIKKKDEEGEKSSEACITIVRADDPVKPPEIKGPQGYVGKDQGGAISQIMFAGQSAEISWEAMAKAFDVRRIISKMPIAFLVSVDKSVPNAKEVEGTYNDNGTEFRNEDGSKPRQEKDPCAWYTDKLGGGGIVKWCGTVDSKSSALVPVPAGTEHEETDNTKGGATIAVPNDVGFKYCNSFGYHWQYRWGVSRNGGAFQYTDGKEYWTIYSAACETIVKKPTVAVWNGGVFTDGDLVATLSSRSHQGDKSEPVIANTMGLQTFGSWTEYLVVANGGVVDFASGATLSRGTASWNSDFATTFSPMTIANVDESGMPSLGHAEIDQNTILTDRLKTYLKPDSGPVDLCTDAKNGQTRIFEMSEIHSDCKTKSEFAINGSYPSIYQIPQNIVISSGDITINSSVTRVDAWIIATEGTLKTCTEFKLEETQTETRDKDFGKTYSSDGCDKKLVINGPVFASRVELNRTYGVDPGGAYSDNSKNDPDNQFYTPAEVFNLSAENYLWAYAQAGRYQSSYTNAYARELPPRY